MRTHSKTYQKCFIACQPYLSGLCPRPCLISDRKQGGHKLQDPKNPLGATASSYFCLDLEEQCAGLLTNMHLGVKSCNTRQGATAGTAKHFTELPDCPSELRLGWCTGTRLVLGHPNALGRCCFFGGPDVLSECST